MASWLTDDSSQFHIVSANMLSCTGGETKDIYNAMWEDGEGVSSGCHYWNIQFITLVGGAAVGLTSLDRFREGYECQAIMYSGDLRNGLKGDPGLLIRNFGPHISEAVTIGILAVFDDAKLKVYIDIAGISLGLAFDVPASTFTSIFPMVSFFHTGVVVCTKHMRTRDLSIRSPIIFTCIEGEWLLKHFDDATLFFVNAPRAKFDAVNKDEQYTWYIDNFRAKLRKLAGIWSTEFVLSSGKTNSPERLEEEKAIRGLMAEVRTIQIDGDDQLIVNSTQHTSVWIRNNIPPAPFVGDPFGPEPSNEQL